MFTNYLKIAWRNLLKHKTFSFINISGLAIGLSCFLLITIFVLDELSFDRFHEKGTRIFRINTDLKFNGSELKMPVSSDMAGQTLKKDYPQVEDYTRIFQSGNRLVKHGNTFVKEYRTANVDSSFFSVFTFPAIAGNTARALVEPNTVVITASTARKYFGSTDVLGKTIETNDRDKTIYTVTAVIRDMPENAQFHFDFLFSMRNVDYPWGNYISNNFYTYILLKEGVNYKAFEKNFPEYLNRYVIPQASQVMQIKSMEEFEKAGNKLSYSLVPLTQVHLYSTDRDWELSPPGSIQYVYIFSGVAVFILLIACINFMNLTTARSANRAKEVGIRKVLGTERKYLTMQFLFESIMMVVLSMIIAIGIAALVLPYFNSLAGKSMSLSSIVSEGYLPFILALPIIVGLLAGSYPAFFLSAFRPVEVLKGKLKVGGKAIQLRSVLVVFQFTTSIMLIIGTIIIYQQLGYIQTKNLGFNKDQVLIVDDAYALGNNLQAFKSEIVKLPAVSSGTISGYLPVSSNRSDYTYSTTPVMNAKSGLDLQVWDIDYDYLKTMGMQLSMGRNFSRDFADSSAIIINETAARLLNMKEPLGKKIYSVEMGPGTPPRALNIVGVVKNFHYASLRENIAPLCFRLGNNAGTACFRVGATNIPSLLKAVEDKWKTLAPGMPLSYRFMDEAFNDMYRAEQRIGKIVLIFSILAIIVASLGLFGLATFIAEQRTKEIGIRKVLGASVQGIVELLSRDFIILVFIAFVIAVPVSWFLMHKWLQDFAYRVQISGWVFAGAGLLALIIALLTISSQAIRAAVSNPAKSLKEI